MRYVIMENNDYSWARKRIELVKAIFEMATAIVSFALVAHQLVSVAFNYPRSPSCKPM